MEAYENATRIRKGEERKKFLKMMEARRIKLREQLQKEKEQAIRNRQQNILDAIQRKAKLRKQNIGSTVQSVKVQQQKIWDQARRNMEAARKKFQKNVNLKNAESRPSTSTSDSKD